MTNPTALIAEDEPLLADNLRAELARLWPELQIVAMAPHGQAAVDQALALKPSICFLDIRMPGLSGLEAAAALTEDWADDAPFPLLVFVTAYDQYALQATRTPRTASSTFAPTRSSQGTSPAAPQQLHNTTSSRRTSATTCTTAGAA